MKWNIKNIKVNFQLIRELMPMLYFQFISNFTKKVQKSRIEKNSGYISIKTGCTVSRLPLKYNPSF